MERGQIKGSRGGGAEKGRGREDREGGRGHR